MAKYKVFIGVGHGGADPGAVGYIEEADVNLVMAKACRDYLKKYDVDVKMSRTKDENDNVNAEVKECNAYDPDLAVDIHNNSGGGDGFEAFYYSGGGKSKTLASNIEKEVKKIGQNSRGIKTKTYNGKDYFAFIRDTNAPAVILEGVFVDNKKDAAQADTLAEQKAFGVAYAKGILATLGIKETEKTETKKTVTKTTGIKVGDKVILQGFASVYQGADKGKKIPASVKDKVYTVSKVDKTKVLLKEINSWVLLKEVKETISFKVKVTAKSLNVRKGPGTEYKIVQAIVDKGTYSIIEQIGDWGRLKNGAGWIHFGYTKKV